MNAKKLLSLALALIVVLGLFAGCTPKASDIYQPIDEADVVEHSDYTSVYEMIGADITIEDVIEDKNTGLAYVEVDGVKYELGMDFLSMAMVYNTNGSEDAFNQWWKLYIQRWNYLAAEVPLYSNQYFDLYNAKIQNFVTTPYWGVADAIVSASIKEGNANSVILGSSTELSGAFRASSWGKSSPGSSDLDIENLTSGHSTVMTNENGAIVWNMSALAEEPVSSLNEDGTLTYTIKIKEGLLFSDGSAITAKNYIASLLANSTAVSKAAGGSGSSGLNLAGYSAFNGWIGSSADYAQIKADAKAAAKETAEGNGGTFDEAKWEASYVEPAQYFSGVKLLDDYTFSVTYQADYANYHFVMSYAGFTPTPLGLYLGDNEIIVAEDGSCGLADGFYAKVEKDGAETYAMADVILANLKWDSNLPYSGPYVVSNYDAANLIATLTLNPNYSGDDVRGKASIETITYVKIVSETQMDQFTSGQVDVLAGITGGDETKAALAVVEANPDKYAETHYDRAGYGKLGFRCDYGPTNFVEVRQAIMYTINRPEFAQTFTGGYGSVVHGPYYEGYSAFQAVKDEIILNQYTYSTDSAIAVLEEGGWIYNAEGKEYDPEKDAVRYKKLSGYEISSANINYASVDGAYKTVKIDGEYYMPLAINWYGTQPNNVTDQLITAWQDNDNANSVIGAYITYTTCDFTSGLYGEYLQYEEYGWSGKCQLSCINFATGFTSAIYDYSWNWTINPDLYDIYSAYYLKDEADYWENYQIAE